MLYYYKIFMDFFSTIFLGFLQGVLEFLPVSSSGHLSLARNIFELKVDDGLAIDAILHLATSLAIIIYFRKEIFVLVQTFLRKLGRLPVNEKDLTFLYALLIGTIPAVVAGLLLESFFTDYREKITVVAFGLFLSALTFIFTEWRCFTNPVRQDLSVRSGFRIGLFQVLALIPGLSRSGITISAGMLLGLTRKEAAVFSFLLAIPITLGLGLKKFLELLTSDIAISWSPLFTGAAVSFFVALMTIHFFINFINKHTLWPFAWYLLAVSSLVFYYQWFVV